LAARSEIFKRIQMREILGSLGFANRIGAVGLEFSFIYKEVSSINLEWRLDTELCIQTMLRDQMALQ
jgi:hypothetical protein